MGIPAAFRWLSTKYPKIISPVIEDQPVVMEDGSVIPVDATRPNPNGEEFDNLYLDMNGIVHPCSHPEDKPAPKDEEEMMVEIFKYTDRVVNMVRPRKLLMIAIDGVAPRAKMNQQRSRRFRSAREAAEKAQEQKMLLQMLQKEKGSKMKEQPVEEVVKKAFDSNTITPGTPFMDILAASLRYWCSYKLNTDPAWAKMKVIISDATVPGEGEHKIMDFVRAQRASPEHNPNTRHVIYGLDADLIMLGLATHEPHFRVLREDVFAQDSRPRLCKLCGQKGHEERNCRGEAKEKDGEFGEKDSVHPPKPFIWLHVSVLREYLAVELEVPGLPFPFALERAIDDWVCMCSFVGNDFLPHLPALEIRENGIDTLTTIWKDNLPVMGGYMTKDGRVNLERVQYILAGLAKQEDAIFRRRKAAEDRREAGIKRRKLNEQGAAGRRGNQESPTVRPTKSGRRNQPPEANGPPPGMTLHPVTNFPRKVPQAITHDMVVNRKAVDEANVANKSAASVLKSLMAQGKAATQGAETKEPDAEAEAEAEVEAEAEPEPPKSSPPSALGKRKAELIEDDANNGGTTSDSDTAAGGEDGPVDTVRMWEEGYADRYYEQKFGADPKDIEFRHKVARSYVEGLAWVLEYYFQGCPSWEWYYPYHYAPFAADFVDLAKMEIKFEKGRTSRPFEQLMSVLPAASRAAIPEVYHDLMTKEDSEIIDFYPEDFVIDLNGKKMAWQGVALLPFIDMQRLLAAMETKNHLLSAEDELRNKPGHDVLIISDAHGALYDEITTRFYAKKKDTTAFDLDPTTSGGLPGRVKKVEGYIPHGSLVYPLSRNTMPDVEYDRSLTVEYEFPKSMGTHKSMLLRGAKMPTPALTRSDIEEIKGKSRRNGRSYGGAPLRDNYNGGRGERPISYGPGAGGYGGRGGYNNGQSRGGGHRNSYDDGRSNRYGNGGNGGGGRDHYGPPPGWVPPPSMMVREVLPQPGMPGFGVGAPPPPPPAHLAGGNRQANQGYGQGYHQGYGGERYPPGPPPPSRGGYGQGYGGQAYRPPGPPPILQGGRRDDRQYDNRDNGRQYDNRDNRRQYDNRDNRGYRDSRGYR